MTGKLLLAIAVVLVSLGLAPIAPAQDSLSLMIMPIQSGAPGLTTEVATFSDQIKEYFSNRPQVVMLSGDQLESLLGSVTGNRQQLIKAAGEKLGCKSALLITLKRYRERLGDEYSVTDPASLAFEYRLVSVADGKVLCFGQFDETQQPLTENILTFKQAYKRGFKWITVADLTREALAKKFSSCAPLAATAP